jgi:nicotinamidase-related amidase
VNSKKSNARTVCCFSSQANSDAGPSSRTGIGGETEDLRDVNAFIIVGVATEIGIEPTARHGADLGYIPVLITDACGSGNEAAAKRSVESLQFAGDALLTETETVCDVLRRRSKVGSS